MLKLSRGFNLNKHLPTVIFLIFGVIYFIIIFCNHYFFRTYCYDYGAYNFAFYDYAHFRISESPVYQIPHMSFLQDHVSFIFFLFIPLYWIFGWITGTYTLLIIQTLIVLFGGWAVYKLLMCKTNNNFLSTLAVLQYFFLLGRWTSFVGDCNLAIIASSMIPVFLYYFEKEYNWAAFFVLVFILIAREDMSLWLFFIGIFLLISHYKDAKLRKYAIGVVIFSLTYFVLVFKFLIPLIETPEKPYFLFNYNTLGNNPYEALVFILKNPIDALKLLFINTSGEAAYDFVKTRFYLYYFLCGGFLLFYKPKYLLLFIPIIAKKMWNDLPVRWGMEWYYAIEFVSILPIAVFLILSDIKRVKIRNTFLAILCICSVFLTLYYFNGSNRKVDWWGDRKYAFYKTSMYKADFNVTQNIQFSKS
jgi:uncharacterized membrane protein